MQLLKRDEEIIRLVGQFKQLKTGHIKRLVFPHRSRVACDNVLARLTDRRYLRSLGRTRSPDTGGSGSRVYQVGANGWRIAGGKKANYLKIHDHFLAVADAFVALDTAAQLGVLNFGCTLEVPVSKETRADMLVTVNQRYKPVPAAFYVEVEVCFKGPKLIRDKLDGYVRAWDADTTGGFPLVVVMAPDVDREFVIRSIIEEMDEDDRRLFKVCQVDQLVATMLLEDS